MFAERVTITTLVENYIDMLLPDTEVVKRAGLAHHFDLRKQPIWAENGLALLVDVEGGGRRSTFLFDAGLTPEVLLHNMRALERRPDEIDAIVISHGHPDHYGGLRGLLKEIDRPVPVIIHPDAFYPRFVDTESGLVIPHYNRLMDQGALQALGANLVLTRTSVPLGPGAATTGEIDRSTIDFEPPDPGGLFRVRDGIYEHDPVMDEQGVYIRLKDRGLVVLVGCGHAGALNTVMQARRLAGEERVYAVIGAFHLVYTAIPESVVDQTVAQLQLLAPAIVSPMHCSGFRTQVAIARELPAAFVHNTAGCIIKLQR
jgi:7,8-dihydropterin-6-yl-methyl-4-(beta-D-ribofuranosyl)aminobenzene 5'-phosphate synthase